MKTFTSFRGLTPNNARTRNIDHIFDDTRRRMFGDHTPGDGFELSVPTANITQFDEPERAGYLIEVAAPGYEKSDFDVSVYEDILTISGELQEDRVRDRSSFSRREHNYHTFSRSFTLPESADETNITANYRNGILHVFVPVLKPVEETKKPRRIEVGS